MLKDQEMLQIAMRPAVELSYLRKEEQADLFAIMDEMDCTPSHAQAIKMRQMSEAKTGGGTAGQRRTRFHYEGGKAQPGGAIQNTKK